MEEKPLVEETSGGENAGEKKPVAPPRSGHLMCGVRFWGVAGALGCGYLAYLSFSRLRSGDFSWSHDWQSLLTGAVWIVLIVALLSETRCWRERIFFGLVFINFTLWFVLSAWAAAPDSDVRELRQVSFGLWILAAVASLMTTVGSKPSGGSAT